MKKYKLSPSISGGLILSYKCNAACRHCMYGCSPAWDAEWISKSDLELILDRLAGKIIPSPIGIDKISVNHGLHFSGGEPFLNYSLLLDAVKIASYLKIPSTFVETNCFWCRNDDVTIEKLQLLKQNGLKGILISVNPYYAEYVPFERTERCIRLAYEIFRENVIVYQYEYYYLFKELGIIDRISLDQYLKLVNQRNIADQVELFLMGKAVTQLADYYPKFPANIFFEQPCRPPFFRFWHNHFDNYGNLIPGYCGGISLGNWHYLGQLIEEGIDIDNCPVLESLIEDEFKNLYYFACDYGYKEDSAGYLSKCDLCLSIRKHLIKKKKFKELQPLQFYNHV